MNSYIAIKESFGMLRRGDHWSPVNAKAETEKEMHYDRS